MGFQPHALSLSRPWWSLIGHGVVRPRSASARSSSGILLLSARTSIDYSSERGHRCWSPTCRRGSAAQLLERWPVCVFLQPGGEGLAGPVPTFQPRRSKRCRVVLSAWLAARCIVLASRRGSRSYGAVDAQASGSTAIPVGKQARDPLRQEWNPPAADMEEKK